jgi:lysophospholipase L1-like esterase
MLAGLGAGAASPWTAALAGAPPRSRDLALWGDSLTDLYQWNLARLLGGERQVFNGGVPGETARQIRTRVEADRAHRDRIAVFWLGHNDHDKTAVPAEVAACVASLRPDPRRYLVLPMLGWAADGRKGMPMHRQIVAANARLQALHPANFVDIRAHLLGLADRNQPADLQDQRDEVTPSSLRLDGIHLNTAGCDAVAARIRQEIVSRGW